MKPIRTMVLALVAAALIAPAAAHAQKKKRKQATADQQELSKEKRDKVRQRIRAMREWKLTEALELDSDTAEKLFPILDSYDEKFAKTMRQGRKLRRKLRKQVEADKVNDAQLDKLVDQMLVNQRLIWDLNEKRFKAARKVLSAEQSAKALIVLPQIDHHIRREMGKALDGRKGRPGRKGRRGRPEFKDPF